MKEFEKESLAFTPGPPLETADGVVRSRPPEEQLPAATGAQRACRAAVLPAGGVGADTGSTGGACVRSFDLRSRDGPTQLREREGRREDPGRDPESKKGSRLFRFSDPQPGVAPGQDPRPPCAFKMSMFNVFCNSH